MWLSNITGVCFMQKYDTEPGKCASGLTKKRGVVEAEFLTGHNQNFALKIHFPSLTAFDVPSTASGTGESTALYECAAARVKPAPNDLQLGFHCMLLEKGTLGKPRNSGSRSFPPKAALPTRTRPPGFSSQPRSHT